MIQRRLITFGLGLVVTLGFCQPSQAIMQFQKEFVNLYVGADKDSDYAKLVKSAGCFCCHQGKKRKNGNAYGAQLAELLDKRADAKKPAKIVEALKKVAEMHSVAGDDKSPTFGALIAEGKLPGGSVEDSKKEPAAN